MVSFSLTKPKPATTHPNATMESAYGAQPLPPLPGAFRSH